MFRSFQEIGMFNNSLLFFPSMTSSDLGTRDNCLRPKIFYFPHYRYCINIFQNSILTPCCNIFSILHVPKSLICCRIFALLFDATQLSQAPLWWAYLYSLILWKQLENVALKKWETGIGLTKMQGWALRSFPFRTFCSFPF